METCVVGLLQLRPIGALSPGKAVPSSDGPWNQWQRLRVGGVQEQGNSLVVVQQQQQQQFLQ